MLKDGMQATEEPIHSFLMIGQSNMAGRGTIGDVPPIENPDCLMLRMGRWQPMSEPVNPDRALSGIPFPSGISLAESFADEYAKAYGVKAGLIPCADGGTRIDQWLPGEVLYDHAVFMARLARRTSTLRGILWHQGESDCRSEETVLAYRQKLITLMTALRRDLDADGVPLVLGELSCSDDLKGDSKERHVLFNRELAQTARQLPLCAVASSADLALKPDRIHFDAASCRLFGKRYFSAYSSLV